MSDYQIISYEPAFKPQLLQLQTDLWGSDAALNQAYFEWKYERNPYQREPLIYVALHQGRAVAMRAMAAARWELGEGIPATQWPCASDLVVATAHRNKGIFQQIMTTALRDLTARGCDYVLSLSAFHLTRLMSLASGWKNIAAMTPIGRTTTSAARELAWREAMSHKPLLWRFADAHLLRGAAARCFARLDALPASAGVTVSAQPRAQAMAELVARLPYHGRIRHVRDAEFIAWRYANPMQEYRFLYVEDRASRRLEGYLVLQRYRARHGNQARVNMVDWEASSRQVRDALLRAVLHYGRPAQLVAWAATLNPEALALARDHGMVAIDLDSAARGLPSAMVRATSDAALKSEWRVAGRLVTDAAQWDLRMIYSSLA